MLLLKTTLGSQEQCLWRDGGGRVKGLSFRRFRWSSTDPRPRAVMHSSYGTVMLSPYCHRPVASATLFGAFTNTLALLPDTVSS